MVNARLRELLPLERRLVLRVLAQVAVGARLLDLLRQDEGDLVVQPFDLVLELLFEAFNHAGILTDKPPSRLVFNRAHLPPADRPRPLRLGRPDRRPTQTRGGAFGEGAADRRRHEWRGRRGKELRDGAPGERLRPRWSQRGRARRRLERPYDPRPALGLPRTTHDARAP